MYIRKRRFHNYYVYIMASKTRTLYVGMTNNLLKRVVDHREGMIEGFSKKYKTKMLVYYEHFLYVHDAIDREKEIKAWRREKKVKLIESMNPTWQDLYDEIDQ